MLNKQDKKIIANAKKTALKGLEKFGIKDKFMVRVKDPKKENWVAQYRCFSQFGKFGPIFWISPCLLNQQDELIISMLHEYGHVIAEYAWLKNTSIQKLIRRHWPGKDNLLNRDWDEEEFAEDFAHYIFGSSFVSSLIDKDAINKILKIYNKEVFID